MNIMAADQPRERITHGLHIAITLYKEVLIGLILVLLQRNGELDSQANNLSMG